MTSVMTSVRLSGGAGGECSHGVPLYRSCAECERRTGYPDDDPDARPDPDRARLAYVSDDTTEAP